MKIKTSLMISSGALASLALLTPQPSYGIANFARKYAVDCSTCHSPAVPRLNAFGHQFRKMGYRMDTEIQKGKPEAYKELGNYVSLRFRTGYSVESFSKGVKGGERNGFNRPDVTLFYAGALTKNLSLFAEIEVADVDETEVQAFGEWFGGNAERFYTIRLGQMHTLQRIGWAGFDRPTGISTPDALSSRAVTLSPVPFRIGEDQRGADFAYNFNPESRVIVGVYNGVDQGGHGNEGNGNGSGDADNAKDVLAAYEQMFGIGDFLPDSESGFTLFGYYGTWTQTAGSVNAAGKAGGPISLGNHAGDGDFNEYNFLRAGATLSLVFKIFDPKKVGYSELQGGYFYARDFYPDKFATLSPLAFNGDSIDGHAFWVQAEQRLPHDAAVFARYDQISRSQEDTTAFPGHTGRAAQRKYTLGAVYTVQQYLRLGVEGFVKDAANTDSYGAQVQAMFNF